MAGLQSLRARPVFWAILGLALVISAWNALGFWSELMDDAWISLRYSWNLVLGLGPVYNAGERIEGFSNPVWTALLALWLLVSDNGALGVKVLGLLWHLACVLAAGLLALGLGRPSTRLGEAAAASAAVAVAISLPLNYWATAGLETPQYIALLLGALVALEHERDRPALLPLSALFGALAAISRPEAPLLVFPVVVGRALHFWHDRDRRALARWAVIFGVPTIGYLLFRLAYYGLVLPNTAYVKGAQATTDELYAYIVPWIALEPLIALGGLIGLGLAARARRLDALPLVAMTALGLLFVLRVGGDYMPNQRYLAPVVALLAAGLGAGAVPLVERAAEVNRRLFAGGLYALLLLQAFRSLPVAVAGASEDGEVAFEARPKEAYLPAALHQDMGSAALATWLLERAAPDASVAISTIGAVGYLADWKIIDLFGLVTLESTRLDAPELSAWLRRQEADWIVLRDLNIARFRNLRKAAWLYQDYELVEGTNDSVWIGRRLDTPLATDDEVLANLREAVRRGPYLIALHRARIKWALGVGDRAEREAACRDALALFPDEEGLVERCSRIDRPGRGRPEVPMTPVELGAVKKARGGKERVAEGRGGDEEREERRGKKKEREKKGKKKEREGRGDSG